MQLRVASLLWHKKKRADQIGRLHNFNYINPEEVAHAPG